MKRFCLPQTGPGFPLLSDHCKMHNLLPVTLVHVYNKICDMTYCPFLVIYSSSDK